VRWTDRTVHVICIRPFRTPEQDLRYLHAWRSSSAGRSRVGYGAR
jgi:hypothetical protein